MTKKEAIKLLSWVLNEGTVSEDLEYHGVSVKEAFEIAIKALKQEPIEEKKTGKWIYTGDYITEGMLKCSECDFEHDVSERFLYCPNCGAKMEVEE